MAVTVRVLRSHPQRVRSRQRFHRRIMRRMRVVALDTLSATLMQPILDGRHIRPCRIRIIQECVATEAKCSFGVSRQILDIVRVIARGSMTILALDSRMWRCVQGGDVFVMTFNAGLSTLEFNGKILPLLDVTQAMEVIGKAGTMNAKIIGNEKQAGEENCGDNTCS